MKISPQTNFYSVNFSARKKDIRKADDIQRKVRLEFPMASPSYFDTFYKTIKSTNNRKVNKTANRISDRIDSKLRYLRERAERVEFFDKVIGINTPYATTLNFLKLYKIGNCEEAASSVLSALYANGYTNSHKANLGLNINIKNKKTKQIEYNDTMDIDHTFVITSLEKQEAKPNDYIVIDSWLGFADSISGARAKYKAVYGDKKIKSLSQYCKSMFRVYCAEKYNKIIDLNDYDVETKLVIIPNDRYTDNDYKKLAEYGKEKYPNLLI